MNSIVYKTFKQISLNLSNRFDVIYLFFFLYKRCNNSNMNLILNINKNKKKLKLNNNFIKKMIKIMFQTKSNYIIMNKI